MLVWYGRSRRRHTLIVLLLLLFGSLTAIRFGLRETVESQPPDVELRFRMPNGEIETISSRWPLEYQMPTVDPPEGKVFVNWYLDAELTTRFETNITPLSHRTFFPRFDSIRQELRFIDTYGIVYGRILGDVGSAFNLPAPPQYYGLTFVGYDTELPDSIPLESMLIQALYKPLTQIITLQVGDTEIEIEFGFNQPITTELIQATLDPVDGQDLIGFDVFFEDEETFVPLNEPVPIPEGAIVTPVYEDSTYRIRFFGEGISLRSLSRVMDELIGRLPVPQLDGFQFNGWFEDEAFTSMFDLVLMPARNINLFAKWISVPLALTDEEVSAPAPEATPTPTPEPTLTPPPPSNDDPVVTTYLYEFIDSGVVIASGMLLAGEPVPNPPVVEPTSGIRFNGWSPDVPVTMPSSNQTFVAQYVTLYTLTIVYNDEAGTEEVVELAEGEEHNFASDTTFEQRMSVETNDDVIFQTLFATQTFVVQPLSDDPPPPAIDAFHEDPQLKTNVIPINSGIVMPASDKILYARWNFKVTVEINDPFESGLVLGSGMYFPGQELTEEDFPPLVDAVGYSGLTWSIDGYRVPRVLPTVPQPTVPRRTLVPFLYQLHIGSGQIDGQSGVIQIERFRGDSLPAPELFGYNFEGYYASSDFSDSGVTNYVLNINRLRGRSNTDPFSYYAKWTQLQLNDYTIAFYDSGLNMITSGTFQSGSTIELATPALESVENYVASWRKESGLDQFTVPTKMPFNDVDFIPYYEFSFPVVNSLIGQAVLNGEFNNLSIPPGSTDIMVVSGIIQNLLMSSGTLPLNISIDVTLSGARLNTDGNNTYIISLSGLFQGTDSLSIDTSFVYDDEFKVQNSVKETIDILEDNPTYNVGISETDGATMTGFLFPNSSESTLTTCLNVVGGLIKNELTFTGITVQVTPTLPKPIKSPVKFTITISIGNPVSRSQSLERWVYWNIGGNTFNC
jgi:uncharacterized repeat protein (TIGR02543 family)